MSHTEEYGDIIIVDSLKSLQKVVFNIKSDTDVFSIEIKMDIDYGMNLILHVSMPEEVINVIFSHDISDKQFLECIIWIANYNNNACMEPRREARKIAVEYESISVKKRDLALDIETTVFKKEQKI